MALACATCGRPSPIGRHFCGGCGAALPSPCIGCGAPVSAQERFCRACRAAMPVRCLACGGPNPADTRFCFDCGRPLSSDSALGPRPAASVSGPEPRTPAASASVIQERRLVTVLFCDLVGFTPIAERLDPEEIRELQASYFGQVSGEIARFGGSVEKYAGDAVLALFGVPVAHEDDAARAVRCAIALHAALQPLAVEAHERWSVDLKLRIGVNTGEGVSGTWEAGGRHDYSVTGDFVNTAARLQAAADPGTSLVGAETMRLAQRLIRFGERRELVLKGKTTPVAAYPVHGVREQAAERWEIGGQRVPLLGREQELAQLHSAWERARGGQGQLVTVIGEAGIGKSRLVAELLEQLKAEGHARVLRARGLSYSHQVSLWVLVDLLRDLCGIHEQAAPDEARTRLAETVTLLLAAHDAGTREAAIDALGAVLGLPSSRPPTTDAGRQVQHQILIRTLHLLLSAIAAQTPTVLLLEDLHWVDEASAEVLAAILADIPSLRLLVLTTQRPDGEGLWMRWQWASVLRLPSLPDREVHGLASALMEGVVVNSDLQRHIVERAGGNPFFVEELLRGLQESGALEEQPRQVRLAAGAAERLPSTLTEVLQARLDRLDPSARLVAQVASVIGQRFSVRLLSHVLGEDEAALETPLAALERARIVFPEPSGGREYVLRHATMRDVAYNTLLLRRRRQFHAAVAMALATLYPVDDHAEIIAYHYSHSDEHAAAAAWLERAGDRAASVYANLATIDHYEAARRHLELSSIEGLVMARVDSKQGAVLMTVGRYDEALELLERAAMAYALADDAESVSATTAQIGEVHYRRGTAAEGSARLQPVLASLSARGPSPGLAELYLEVAALCFASNRHAEGLDASLAASELAQATGSTRIRIGAEVSRGAALWNLGRYDEALGVLRKVIPLAQTAGDVSQLSRALANLVIVRHIRGEFEACLPEIQRTLDLAERMDDPHAIMWAMFKLGENCFYRGDWKTARRYTQRAVSVQRSTAPTRVSVYPLLSFGRLSLAEGDAEEGIRYLEECITIAEHRHDLGTLRLVHSLLAEHELLEGRPRQALARLQPFLDHDGSAQHDAIELLPLLGWAYLVLGDAARAADHVGEAIQRARAQSRRVTLAEALRIHAMILTERSYWQEAEESFRSALRLSRDMPYRRSEARAHFDYGIVLDRRGEPARAQEHLTQALAIFERLGARGDAARVGRAMARLA